MKGTATLPIVQKGELRHKEVDHTTRKRCSWDLNPDCLVPFSVDSKTGQMAGSGPATVLVCRCVCVCVGAVR